MVSTRALIQPSPATPDKPEAPPANAGAGQANGGLVDSDDDEQRALSIHRCRYVGVVMRWIDASTDRPNSWDPRSD